MNPSHARSVATTGEGIRTAAEDSSAYRLTETRCLLGHQQRPRSRDDVGTVP